MCLLNQFLSELHEHLVGKKDFDNNIIRTHSRKLEELGDISFPLSKKNWCHLLDQEAKNLESEYIFPERIAQQGLERLSQRSENLKMKIIKHKIIRNDAHIFVERESVFKSTIVDVLTQLYSYGKSEMLFKTMHVTVDNTLENKDLVQLGLTSLRALMLRDVTKNLVKFFVCNSAQADSTENCVIHISPKSSTASSNNCPIILCGPVLNEKGVKDNTVSAQDLYSKRASDMRMMAQHKYGVQIKPNSDWTEYFQKMGRDSVTIEMLSNKPHKSVQILLNDLRTANKGSSFIFYNCARLAALFREFEKRVQENIYPALPDMEKINVSLLNQPVSRINDYIQ